MPKRKRKSNNFTPTIDTPAAAAAAAVDTDAYDDADAGNDTPSAKRSRGTNSTHATASSSSDRDDHDDDKSHTPSRVANSYNDLQKASSLGGEASSEEEASSEDDEVTNRVSHFGRPAAAAAASSSGKNVRGRPHPAYADAASAAAGAGNGDGDLATDRLEEKFLSLESKLLDKCGADSVGAPSEKTVFILKNLEKLRNKETELLNKKYQDLYMSTFLNALSQGLSIKVFSSFIEKIQNATFKNKNVGRKLFLNFFEGSNGDIEHLICTVKRMFDMLASKYSSKMLLAIFQNKKIKQAMKDHDFGGDKPSNAELLTYFKKTLLKALDINLDDSEKDLPSDDNDQSEDEHAAQELDQDADDIAGSAEDDSDHSLSSDKKSETSDNSSVDGNSNDNDNSPSENEDEAQDNDEDIDDTYKTLPSPQAPNAPVSTPKDDGYVHPDDEPQGKGKAKGRGKADYGSAFHSSFQYPAYGAGTEEKAPSAATLAIAVRGRGKGPLLAAPPAGRPAAAAAEPKTPKLNK